MLCASIYPIKSSLPCFYKTKIHNFSFVFNDIHGDILIYIFHLTNFYWSCLFYIFFLLNLVNILCYSIFFSYCLVGTLGIDMHSWLAIVEWINNKTLTNFNSISFLPSLGLLSYSCHVFSTIYFKLHKASLLLLYTVCIHLDYSHLLIFPLNFYSSEIIFLMPKEFPLVFFKVEICWWILLVSIYWEMSLLCLWFGKYFYLGLKFQDGTQWCFPNSFPQS